MSKRSMSNRSMKISILSLMVSFFFLTACSTIQKSPDLSNANDSERSIIAIDLKALSPLGKIAEKLAQHRTVFVGETHTNYTDHLNQLAVIKQLHKRWGNKTSIGLEMIQKPYQIFLNNYIAGKISEKDMLRGTQWYQRWKYDFKLYRPIFNYAKQHKIPLIALNIPTQLTKRLSKVGIKGLSQQERKQLPPIIDRSNKAYIKRITSVFKGHSHTSSKSTNRFIDAQLGWDEGMAFNAANYLKEKPKKRMIILAGSGHIIHYQGIPDRLDRQLNSKSAVVLNSTYDKLEDSGDYLLFSPETKPPSKVQLGIAMEDSKIATGIKVIEVVTHSSAQKAGVKIGDIITKLDEQVITDTIDVKVFLEDKKAGSKIQIIALRNKRTVKMEAQLKSKLSASSFFSHKLKK